MVLYLIIPLFMAMSCLAVIQHRYSNLGILSLMLFISILVVIINRTRISEPIKIKIVGISFKIQVFSFGMYKAGIKGTGYGMSNVKKYIDQHKGNLLIHSEVKKGTMVTISLPVIKKELTDQEIKEVKREVQKKQI